MGKFERLGDSNFGDGATIGDGAIFWVVKVQYRGRRLLHKQKMCGVESRKGECNGCAGLKEAEKRR